MLVDLGFISDFFQLEASTSTIGEDSLVDPAQELRIREYSQRGSVL